MFSHSKTICKVLFIYALPFIHNVYVRERRWMCLIVDIEKHLYQTILRPFLQASISYPPSPTTPKKILLAAAVIYKYWAKWPAAVVFNKKTVFYLHDLKKSYITTNRKIQCTSYNKNIIFFNISLSLQFSGWNSP